jgi:hypothetical protein
MRGSKPQARTEGRFKPALHADSGVTMNVVTSQRQRRWSAEGDVVARPKRRLCTRRRNGTHVVKVKAEPASKGIAEEATTGGTRSPGNERADRRMFCHVENANAEFVRNEVRATYANAN